jgi:SET domain-containing protein
MLLIKTYVGPSKIEGMGLFAAEPVKKGTVTWRFMEGYDRLFTQAEVDALPVVPQGELRRYVYFNEAAGKYVFCLDNARFMNHSDTPNTEGVNPPGDPFGYDVALRDIAAGEELTCDYRDFDAEFAAKLGENRG